MSSKKIPQSRNPVARDERGRIAGGGSLNPGGVPKWRRDFAAAFGERCAPLAEKVLHDVLSGAEPDAKVSDKVSAADTVLKYVLPKPTQQVEVTVPQGAQFAGYTPAELLELAKQKPKDEGET